MKKVRSFLILEDHSLLMNAIQSLLKDTYTNCEIKCFKTVEALKSKVTNFDSHDLLISDLQLEKQFANDLLSEIKRDFNLPILVITMHNSFRTISEIKEMGVEGYILKDDADYFHVAIDRVLNGGEYLSPRVKTTFDSVNMQNMLLTRRQLDIYSLWESNKSNTEIAEELFISVETVKSHKRNIREITGLKSISEITGFLKEKKIV